MPNYEELIELSIRQTAEIVGMQMAIFPLQTIDGVEVTGSGEVTELGGDGAEVLDRLIDAYSDRVGDVPRKSIARTIQAQYDIVDVDLPESLADAMKRAPVNQIIDELDDGVLVTDEEYRIIDINPAAEEILDVRAQAVLADPVETVLPAAHTSSLRPDDGRESDGDAGETTDGGPTGRDDGSGSLPRASPTTDGGEPDLLTIEEGDVRRHYDIRTSSLYDRRGRRAGCAVVLRDVTLQERHRQRLKERTGELERKNARLEQFSSFVSHDLRNPLNVAMAQVETAEITGDYEAVVEEIDVSLERMETMIDELLTIAREGQEVDDESPVDLARVARASWSVVETGDAVLEVVEEMEIVANEDRLRQILENFFRNSVEHGSTNNRPEAGDSVEHGSTGSQSETGDSVEHGREDVTVRVGPVHDGVDASDAFVGFYVADDGAGIPEERRDEVLELGFTTNESGTGFGLGIVSQIVEGHGWEIDVTESAEGGARFEITGVDRPDAA